MLKSIFAFALASASILCVSSSAHAGLCAKSPLTADDWTILGSAPSYPGSQVSYQLDHLKITQRCEDDSTTTCFWSDGDQRELCSTTDGVKVVYQLSVGVDTFDFFGKETTSFGAPVEMQPSSDDAWLFIDTSAEGNPMRVWLRQNGSKLQVVFDVTHNGKLYHQVVDFVHPLNIPIHGLNLGN